MAVTVDSFKAGYPEFAKTDAWLVAAKLNYARMQVDPDIWGEETDMGVELLAAHLISISPFGTQSRLVSKTGETTYLGEYRRLQRNHASGYRVI